MAFEFADHMRRSDLPEYKTLPYSCFDVEDCLHLDKYTPIAEYDHNGFVSGAKGRVRDNADSELLLFEQSRVLYFGDVKVKRVFRMAARDWDEAMRILQYELNHLMMTSIISGWSTI